MSVIYNGRFSGGSRGAAIGHVSPEAAAGGPIAIVKDGDKIELTEIIRTWRTWLLLIAFALFGIADPIIARFTKQIMASVAGGTTPVTIQIGRAHV